MPSIALQKRVSCFTATIVIPASPGEAHRRSFLYVASPESLSVLIQRWVSEVEVRGHLSRGAMEEWMEVIPQPCHRPSVDFCGRPSVQSG